MLNAWGHTVHHVVWNRYRIDSKEQQVRQTNYWNNRLISSVTHRPSFLFLLFPQSTRNSSLKLTETITTWLCSTHSLLILQFASIKQAPAVVLLELVVSSQQTYLNFVPHEIGGGRLVLRSHQNVSFSNFYHRSLWARSCRNCLYTLMVISKCGGAPRKFRSREGQNRSDLVDLLPLTMHVAWSHQLCKGDRRFLPWLLRLTFPLPGNNSPGLSVPHPTKFFTVN